MIGRVRILFFLRSLVDGNEFHGNYQQVFLEIEFAISAQSSRDPSEVKGHKPFFDRGSTCLSSQSPPV